MSSQRNLRQRTPPAPSGSVMNKGNSKTSKDASVDQDPINHISSRRRGIHLPPPLPPKQSGDDFENSELFWDTAGREAVKEDPKYQQTQPKSKRKNREKKQSNGKQKSASLKQHKNSKVDKAAEINTLRSKYVKDIQNVKTPDFSSTRTDDKQKSEENNESAEYFPFELNSGNEDQAKSGTVYLSPAGLSSIASIPPTPGTMSTVNTLSVDQSRIKSPPRSSNSNSLNRTSRNASKIIKEVVENKLSDDNSADSSIDDPNGRDKSGYSSTSRTSRSEPKIIEKITEKINDDDVSGISNDVAKEDRIHDQEDDMLISDGEEADDLFPVQEEENIGHIDLLTKSPKSVKEPEKKKESMLLSTDKVRLPKEKATIPLLETSLEELSSTIMDETKSNESYIENNREEEVSSPEDYNSHQHDGNHLQYDSDKATQHPVDEDISKHGDEQDDNENGYLEASSNHQLASHSKKRGILKESSSKRKRNTKDNNDETDESESEDDTTADKRTKTKAKSKKKTQRRLPSSSTVTPDNQRKRKRRVTYAKGEGYPIGNRDYESVPVAEFKENNNESDEDDTNKGVRRSKRTRFHPLAFWKNERVIYEPHDERGMLGEALGDMPIVSGVIKALPTPHKRKKVSLVSNDSSRKRKSKSRRSEDHDRESVTPFNASKLRKKYAINEGEMASVWDEANGIVDEQKLICYRDNMIVSDLPLKSKRGKRESKVVCKAVQTFNVPSSNESIPGWIAGKLIVPPKGIKDEEGVGLCSQVFNIGDCQPQSLEVAIADPEVNEGKFDSSTAQRFLLSKGDMFQVPAGNIYRIENHSDTYEVTMYWTIIRPVQTKSEE